MGLRTRLRSEMIYDDLEAASTVVLVEGNLPKKYAAFLHVVIFGEQAFLDKLAQVL